MNCDETRRRLSEFLDDKLDPGESGLLADHLASCPSCRTEAETLKQTIQSVSDLPEVEAPPGFSTRVMAKVREIEGMKRTGFWGRLFLPSPIKIPAQLTALFLVGVIGIVLYQSIKPLPFKKNEAKAPESELVQEKDFSRMAEPKKKARVDSPASGDSTGEASNEMDEVASLAPAEAEQFLRESGNKVPGKRAMEEGLLEKSVAQKEQAKAPAVIELVLIPHAPYSDRVQLENKIAGLTEQVGGVFPPNEKAEGKSDRPRSLRIEPAAVYLSIPADQATRFKTLLADLGRVEEGKRDLYDSEGETREEFAKAPLSSGFSMESDIPSSLSSLLIKITLTPPEKP